MSNEISMDKKGLLIKYNLFELFHSTNVKLVDNVPVKSKILIKCVMKTQSGIHFRKSTPLLFNVPKNS